MWKKMLIAHHNFPEPKLTSSKGFFCPTNIPKPKDPSFTIINDKEMQRILTFKKPKPANVLHFCLKNDWNNLSIITIELIFFLLTKNQLITAALHYTCSLITCRRLKLQTSSSFVFSQGLRSVHCSLRYGIIVLYTCILSIWIYNTSVLLCPT